MSKANALLLVIAILSGWVNAEAQTLPSVRVRGVITAFEGHVLQVKTRDSKNLQLNITDLTRINMLYPRKMRDIKKGSFVGVTAIQKAPGAPLLAREVHLFAESQRGTGEGHYDWDLEPGASMTNANIDAIVNTSDGKELTLSYKGGSQKIIVPPGTPIVSFQPTTQSRLRIGTQVFCSTQQAADGSLTALRIIVGKNGMKPPM